MSDSRASDGWDPTDRDATAAELLAGLDRDEHAGHAATVASLSARLAGGKRLTTTQRTVELAGSLLWLIEHGLACEWPRVVARAKPPGEPIAQGVPTLRFDEERRRIEAEKAAAAEPWGELDLGERPVARPFPLDVLPTPLADLAREAAEALPCPPDFIAAAALVAGSGAIGRSLLLRVKESWHESASLYLAICAEPGSTKSEALRIATDPVSRRHARDLFDYGVERQVLKETRRLRDAERRAKGLPADEDGDEAPPLRRVRVGDTTTEKLAVVLSQNPRGVVMIQDELTAWIAGMNQYKGGAGADRQFYLSTWSGAAISIDRKSQLDGVPIHIPHPYLSIVGAATPDLLPELNPQGKEDGFMDRILFIYPDPVRVRFSTRSVSQKLREAWAAAVDRLYCVPLDSGGDAGEPRPNVVRFGRAALERFGSWFDRHCEESEGADFPRHLKGPWAKLRGYCARLTVVLAALHWAYEPDGEALPSVIDAATVDRAIALVEYFKTHIHRTHHEILGGDADNPDARAVLKWLAQRGEPSFTVRDVKRNFARRFESRARDLDGALAWLTHARAVRRRPATKLSQGGRPSEVFDVHPAVFSAKGADKTAKTPSA